MIQSNSTIMAYKFGKKKRMQSIQKGILSFSCIGAFIHEANTTGNTIQGDMYEGVFAHLYKNDRRIEIMQKKLGQDLEILYEGNYVFLRRKSAKFKPVFCIFSYTAQDLINENRFAKVGFQSAILEFDKRMFSGFADFEHNNVLSDENCMSVLFIQPEPFINRIKIALAQSGTPYKSRNVKYKDFQGVFFQEPDDEYSELFIKSDRYSYQHEARICLPNSSFFNIFERKTVTLIPPAREDMILCCKEIFVSYSVNVQQM